MNISKSRAHDSWINTLKIYESWRNISSEKEIEKALQSVQSPNYMINYMSGPNVKGEDSVPSRNRVSAPQMDHRNSFKPCLLIGG